LIVVRFTLTSNCVRVIYNSSLAPHRPHRSIVTHPHPCPSTLDTTRPSCCINPHTLTLSPRLLKGPITPGPSSHVCLASCANLITPRMMTLSHKPQKKRCATAARMTCRCDWAGSPTAAAALACGGDQDAAVADPDCHPVSNNEATLVGTLLNSFGTPETRKSVFTSLTSGGTDALDAVRHSLGVLFILCVVLLLSTFFCPLSLLRRVLSRFFIGMRCAPATNVLFLLFCSFLWARYLTIFCFFFWLSSHIGASSPASPPDR
jgi:hypothetical protein